MDVIEIPSVRLNSFELVKPARLRELSQTWKHYSYIPYCTVSVASRWKCHRWHLKCHLPNRRHSYNTVAVLEHRSTNCPLSHGTCMDPTSWSGRLRRSVPAKVSAVSELRVLSGVYAGLASLFQAAAVERRLLRDMSQRVWTNQVPERERKREWEGRWRTEISLCVSCKELPHGSSDLRRSQTLHCSLHTLSHERHLALKRS